MSKEEGDGFEAALASSSSPPDSIELDGSFHKRNQQHRIKQHRNQQHKISQELRMLSRSLPDCKSVTLNVMIQVWQFVSNNQLCY